MNLREYIKDKRSTLSDGSLTTYTSILRSLYKKVFGAGEGDIDYKKFSDTEKILEQIKDLPPNRRKTILSALVIITDNKKYRELMLEDVRDYNHEISKQEKSNTQEANWVTQDEVKKLYESFKKNANMTI